MKLWQQLSSFPICITQQVKCLASMWNVTGPSCGQVMFSFWQKMLSSALDVKAARFVNVNAGCEWCMSHGQNTVELHS